jgi:hypothetical protein
MFRLKNSQISRFWINNVQTIAKAKKNLQKWLTC